MADPTIVDQPTVVDFLPLVTATMSEIKYHALPKLEQTITVLSGINFWLFTGYETFLPMVLNLSLSTQSIPQDTLISYCLNSVCGDISSLTLLLSEDHRPFARKVKGVIKLGNTGQSTATLLGHAIPVGGVIAAITNFALSFDPLLVAARRHFFINYWLKDSLARLINLEKQFDEAQDELLELLKLSAQYQQISQPENLTLITAFIARKNQALQDRMAELLLLQETILACIGYHKYHNTQHLSAMKHVFDAKNSLLNPVKPYQQRTENFKQQLRTLIDTPPESFIKTFKKTLYGFPKNKTDHQSFSRETSLIDTDLKTYFDKHQQHIQENTKHELKQKTRDTVACALLVVGSVFLCIPGLQLAGLCLCATAVSFKLATAMKNLFTSPKPLNTAIVPPIAALAPVEVPSNEILSISPIPKPVVNDTNYEVMTNPTPILIKQQNDMSLNPTSSIITEALPIMHSEKNATAEPPSIPQKLTNDAPQNIDFKPTFEAVPPAASVDVTLKSLEPQQSLLQRITPGIGVGLAVIAGIYALAPPLDEVLNYFT